MTIATRIGSVAVCPTWRASHFPRVLNTPPLRRAVSFARRSISPCRRYAPPAANRSRAKACARRAGRSFPSSPGPIASGSAFLSCMTRVRASCPWRRSPPRRPINRARAAVRFDEISRALVHALKYGDRLDLAPMMGRWIANAGGELLAEADALVPVPLHWRRLWARRFNQSAILAATISKESGVPIATGSAQARPGDRTASRAVTERASHQYPGRLSRTRGRQGRRRRPPPGAGR